MECGGAGGGAGVTSVSGFAESEAAHVLPVEERLLEDLLLFWGRPFVDGSQIQRVVDAHDLERVRILFVDF